MRNRSRWILTPLAWGTFFLTFAIPLMGGENAPQRDAQMSWVEKSREVTPSARYLHIPVDMTAEITFVRVETGGQWRAEFQIPLAAHEDEVDFYGTLDVGDSAGQSVRLIAERVASDSEGLSLVRESDELSDSDSVYREKYRPQFHFAPRRGWTNDPNGLHYYNGEYHLFYQHNPFSTKWGNMTWGHAVSPDLIHWTETGDVLLPDRLGTIFSGSGVVDWNNTSGLAPKDSPFAPQVLLYTSNGPEARPGVPVTQSLAFSIDGGKTWTKSEENPVLPHIIGGNRDPKVFWHGPSNQWVMALYLDGEDYALFGSPNLKKWKELCRIEKLGCSECPDMFELPVDGDENNKKWVFWGGNGKYLIGDFDGKTFTAESEPLPSKFSGNDYAAQTFSDVPDGRRIQFSWMQGGEYPGMPFNQQFSIPRELSLKTTNAGIRLCFAPVRELAEWRGGALYDLSTAFELKDAARTFDRLPELIDVETVVDMTEGERFSIQFRGVNLVYDAEAGTMNGVPAKTDDNRLNIRLVIDRMSYELFVNGNEKAQCFVPSDEILAATQAGEGTLTLEAKGDARVESLKIYPLPSIWK